MSPWPSEEPFHHRRDRAEIDESPHFFAAFFFGRLRRCRATPNCTMFSGILAYKGVRAIAQYGMSTMYTTTFATREGPTMSMCESRETGGLAVL